MITNETDYPRETEKATMDLLQQLRPEAISLNDRCWVSALLVAVQQKPCYISTSRRNRRSAFSV